MQAAKLRVATPRTITPKPFGTLDGHSGMPQQVPGQSKPTDWIANRLPSSRQVSRIRLQSFTGLSAASIDASDVTLNIGQACRRTALTPGPPKRDLSLIDHDRMNSAG